MRITGFVWTVTAIWVGFVVAFLILVVDLVWSKRQDQHRRWLLDHPPASLTRLLDQQFGKGDRLDARP